MLLDTRAEQLAEIERLRVENAILAERNRLWAENRQLRAARRAAKLARRSAIQKPPTLIATAGGAPVPIRAPIPKPAPVVAPAPAAKPKRAGRKPPDLGGVEITLYTAATAPHAPAGGVAPEASDEVRAAWAAHVADPERVSHPRGETCVACAWSAAVRDRKRADALQKIRRFQATGSLAGVLPVTVFERRARMSDEEARRVVLPNLCGPDPLKSPEDRVLTNAVERYLQARGERETEKRDNYGRAVWTCGCAAGSASRPEPCARHRWALKGRPDEGVVIYERRKAA